MTGDLPGVTLRDAVAADAARIGEVWYAAWQWAYRGLLADDLLDAISVEGAAERWATNIARAVPPVYLTVAEVDGLIGGYVNGGPERTGGAPTGRGEVYSINLHPDVASGGVGRRLLESATRTMREGGYGEAILWVLRTNARARRFYEIAGWVPDGVEQVVIQSGHPIDEVRYTRNLLGR
ncbi:MAG: GNAT family N-acetyltransferase [Candidatus Dormibacteria bacterium]